MNGNIGREEYRAYQNEQKYSDWYILRDGTGFAVLSGISEWTGILGSIKILELIEKLGFQMISDYQAILKWIEILVQRNRCKFKMSEKNWKENGDLRKYWDWQKYFIITFS